MTTLVEIRSYQLKQNTGAEFHELISRRSLPLMQARGMRVLAARASLHSPAAYLLIRAYDSVEERQRSQDAFYNSPEWLRGPSEAIMACIAHYTTVLIEADDSLIAALSRGDRLA